MTHPIPYELFISPRSPFVRRVRLALRRIGLPVIETPCDVFADPAGLLRVNPLGLIPALRTPEGESLSDSSAILEFLDDLSGAIWPRSPPDRARVRQASVLAEGIMQSAVLFYQETAMHEVPSPSWARDHLETIDRTIRAITSSPRTLWIREEGLSQAGWDLAVALESVEFRAPAISVPQDHPLIKEVRFRAETSTAFLETKIPRGN
jgi:glutathione S-transferase